MKHAIAFAEGPASRCGLAACVAALSMIVLSLLSHSLSAQQVTGTKGDYKAPVDQKTQNGDGPPQSSVPQSAVPQSTVPQSTVPQSTVPKSIYLTPKSDRLGQPATKDQDQPTGSKTTGNKSDRQHVSPSDEEPWVEEPDEENLAITDTQANPDSESTGKVPEITIPFNPNANKPARKTAPKLRKKRKARARRPIDIAYKNGRLKLNRFHTLKIDMAHHDCRDFPNIFLADYKLSRKAIDILSDNMLIVQKRICADNGAVLITCYQNSATISMRRARPDDGCKRK